MSREDIARAAKARAAAARSAMARAIRITAATRAASDNSLDMTVMRLRESSRRRCEVCSGRADIGECICPIRCTAPDCPRDPELAEDEASIP